MRLIHSHFSCNSLPVRRYIKKKKSPDLSLKEKVNWFRVGFPQIGFLLAPASRDEAGPLLTLMNTFGSLSAVHPAKNYSNMNSRAEISMEFPRHLVFRRRRVVHRTEVPADKRGFSMMYHFFGVGSGPSRLPTGFALEKKLLTGQHWIGHKHCISVIGWIELIQAGGSLSACLLLLTNLRGKIGIQLVWPEELSPSLSPSLLCLLSNLLALL